jgi:hypothetical protein
VTESKKKNGFCNKEQRRRDGGREKKNLQQKVEEPI